RSCRRRMPRERAEFSRESFPFFRSFCGHGRRPLTGPGRPRCLHVSVAAEGFQAAAVFLVLGAAGAFRDIGELAGPELCDDFGNVPGSRFHRGRAWVAAEGPVPLARALVEIEVGDGDVLPFYV